ASANTRAGSSAGPRAGSAVSITGSDLQAVLQGGLPLPRGSAEAREVDLALVLVVDRLALDVAELGEDVGGEPRHLGHVARRVLHERLLVGREVQALHGAEVAGGQSLADGLVPVHRHQRLPYVLPAHVILRSAVVPHQPTTPRSAVLGPAQV